MAKDRKNNDEHNEELEKDLKEEKQEEEKEEEKKEKKSDALKDEDEEEVIDESQVVDEIENLKNSLLRLQADFNNYKKRTDKEKSEIIVSANADLICEILPVLDNFNRAFDAAEAAEVNPELLEGFRLIQKDLISILSAQGLEAIESDGQVFDPNYHQAIATEKSDGEAGIVLETLQKGYIFNDKVLRPSIVKVSE